MKKMYTILKTTNVEPVYSVSHYYEPREDGTVRACALTALVLGVVPTAKFSGFSFIDNIKDKDNFAYLITEFVQEKFGISKKEAYLISDAFCLSDGNFDVAAEVASWIENGLPINEVKEIVASLR